MTNTDMIRRDLIQLNWTVADQNEYFDQMSDKLERLGYVKNTFREAIAARETQFPTALPTRPEAVAIPHSDVKHILRPFIASTRLASPVGWREMGNSSSELPVRFVFMLGFLDTDDHVELLQVMLESIMDTGFIQKLESARTDDEYYDVVHVMARGGPAATGIG